MKYNANKDYITADSLMQCAKAFLQEGQKVDNYITPLDAHEDWWKDLAVRDICVFMGRYELFAHDLVTFARKVGVSLKAILKFEELQAKNLGTGAQSQVGTGHRAVRNSRPAHH